MDSQFNSIKPAAVPFSTLITTTMGCRLFLNLKLYHQREAERITPFFSHSRSNSGDDADQRTTLLPSSSSYVQRKPLSLIVQGKHLPPQPAELRLESPIYSMRPPRDRDQSFEKYIRRALPPVPPPRQTVPQDVYPHGHEQEFDTFLKDDDVQLVGSPV